ncbi:N-alpha-acetyltransferase mak3 [Serendipita sp. 401]|nr:N-alpha-acetyltransferase mak3 [Serendipita sp. 401]KAG9058485.1 N-alpha-acetyltransferase mak3 [Serendipita sp. 407]
MWAQSAEIKSSDFGPRGNLDPATTLAFVHLCKFQQPEPTDTLRKQGAHSTPQLPAPVIAYRKPTKEIYGAEDDLQPRRNLLPPVQWGDGPQVHHEPRRERAQRALCDLHVSLLPSRMAFPEPAVGETYATTKPIGVIVCKQSIHRGKARRGYIAMLSVDRAWRKRGIASTLVKLSIDMMTRTGADEIVLETEVDNTAALALYASLGFIREKRLYRFYMNGKDAFRLVLPVIPDERMLPDVTISTSIATLNVGGKLGHATSSTIPIGIPGVPKVATLDSPPSPSYPIHNRLPTSGSTSPSDKDMHSPMETSTSFAKGGLLGAASPRSVESNDSFTLYGSHIPSSISPPLPPRQQSSARATPVAYEDDDDYTSGR